MNRLCVSMILVLLTAGSAASVVGASDPTVRAPIPSAGCGSSTAEPGLLLMQTLEIDGLERTWSMRVPPSHDGVTPLPMWLQLHGCCGGSGADQAIRHMPAADEHGFVMVGPDSWLGFGGDWMFDAETTVLDTSASNPDIAFVDALIDHLGAELCIDLARVYAAGYSAGGHGASILGCVLEERIAAVAPVAGTLDLGDDCRLDRPVPLLAIHAVNDGNDYFEGGHSPDRNDWPIYQAYAQASIPEQVANVAQRNGCGPEPTIEAIGEDVERWTWPCPSGAEVELIVHERGHVWPSASKAGFSGTELVWDFFEQHPMPE